MEVEAFGRWACREWGLGEQFRAIDLGGSVDRTTQITTPGGEFFAKRWSLLRHSRQDVEAVCRAGALLSWPHVDTQSSRSARLVELYRDGVPVSVTKGAGEPIARAGRIAAGDPVLGWASGFTCKVAMNALPTWDLAHFEAVYSLSARTDKHIWEQVGPWAECAYGRASFGLIHGDIAPGNIVVDEAGVARLCDFGHVGNGPLWLELGNWVTAAALASWPPINSARLRDHALALSLRFFLDVEDVMLGAALRASRGIAMMAQYRSITSSGKRYLESLRNICMAVLHWRTERF